MSGVGWAFDGGLGCSPVISAYGMGAQASYQEHRCLVHGQAVPPAELAPPTLLLFSLHWMMPGFSRSLPPPCTFGFGHVEL